MFNSRDFFSAKINTREEMSVDALTYLVLLFVSTDKKQTGLCKLGRHARSKFGLRQVIGMYSRDFFSAKINTREECERVR